MHTIGLPSFPNSLHLLSSVSWTHRIPAGLPSGIPGIGDDIDGAMQHAPQPALHSKSFAPFPCKTKLTKSTSACIDVIEKYTLMSMMMRLLFYWQVIFNLSLLLWLWCFLVGDETICSI